MRIRKSRNDSWRFEHLEHYSFVELFGLKREIETRLATLRKQEPSARRKKTADYAVWVGQNVECIEHLQRIRSEIIRRKERAFRIGITGNFHDANVLML